MYNFCAPVIRVLQKITFPISINISFAAQGHYQKINIWLIEPISTWQRSYFWKYSAKYFMTSWVLKFFSHQSLQNEGWQGQKYKKIIISRMIRVFWVEIKWIFPILKCLSANLIKATCPEMADITFN